MALIAVCRLQLIDHSVFEFGAFIGAAFLKVVVLLELATDFTVTLHKIYV
jgi:hypothetical protein